MVMKIYVLTIHICAFYSIFLELKTILGHFFGIEFKLWNVVKLQIDKFYPNNFFKDNFNPLCHGKE